MRGNVCELSLASWSSPSPSSPLSSLSALRKNSNNSSLLLLGKSIVFQQHPKQLQQQQPSSHQKGASHNKTLINGKSNNNNHGSPMRHIKRIKQLFLPVCAHEIKHEIANHYRDVKNKKASKEARAKAKRSVAALYRKEQLQHQQQLQELRKKAAFAKLVSTAIVHRRRATTTTAAAAQSPPPSSSIHHHHHQRRFTLSHQRNILQIPSFTFPRIISHESTVNVRKGRQTLCNLHRPNDLYSVEQASGRTPLTINTSTAPIALNRLLLKGHQKDRTQLFASFQSIVCNAKASPIKPNLFQSIASCWPEYRAQTSYFCHPLPPPPPASHCCCRRRRRRACTTNQQQQKSHVGIRTVTTKTAPPNCNYNRQQRKTYSDNIDTDGNNKNNQNHSSSNDDNRDCIKSSSNTIDTNKTGWYIHLASNCYRNGFQLHVNHLDEWSKHPCLVQRKPIQVLSFLRLPSSALQPTTSAVSGKKTVRVSYDNYQPSDTACDFVGDSSIVTSQPIRVSCEQINLNGNKINDCIEKSPSRLAHQLKSDDIKRIYVKNSLKPSDTHQHLNRSIDDSSKLPIIDTERIAGEQEEQQQQQVQRHNDNIKQQFDTPNAKNTMNSSRIAIDANIHLPPTTNRQLSCQAIQNNYHNNNLTFDREFHAGAEQSVPPTHTLVNAASVTATDATTIADNAATIFNNTNNVNNNQHQQHHHHWLNENNSNAIVSTTNPQSIGTRPPTAPNHIDDIVIDDLIESFHTKFDVIDPTQRRKLPQITLSDFSNNQLSLTSSASPSPSALLSASLPASTAAAAAATPLAFAIQSTHTLSEHPDQLQHFFYQTANTQ